MNTRWEARKSSEGWWGCWDNWSQCWARESFSSDARRWSSKSGAQKAARRMNQ